MEPLLKPSSLSKLPAPYAMELEPKVQKISNLVVDVLERASLFEMNKIFMVSFLKLKQFVLYAKDQAKRLLKFVTVAEEQS